MPKVKLDTSSLPLNGQRVTWICIEDEEKQHWKKGKYNAAEGEECFMIDKTEDEKEEEFNTPWTVLEWKPLE